VSGSLIATLSGHTAKVNKAAFSPKGDRVVTGSDDGTARLWDVGAQAHWKYSLDHADKVKLVAFSPDGGQILTASYDNTARLWDATTGAMLLTFLKHPDQQNRQAPLVCAAFNSDGTLIATAWDSTVQIWDTATGATVGVLSGHAGGVKSIAFSPDGKRLV